MSITIHIYYTGNEPGAAAAFAAEMERQGIADRIRQEPGNLQDASTVLLIDSWLDQAALDQHHASPMMAEIAALRERYDLHMKVERFVSAEAERGDEQFIRK